jgi:hypothetical protein
MGPRLDSSLACASDPLSSPSPGLGLQVSSNTLYLYFQFGTGSLIGQELDKSTRWAGQGGSGIRRNRHRGSLNLSVFATLKQGVLYIKKPNITSLVSACHHRILTHLASRTLIPGTPPPTRLGWSVAHHVDFCILLIQFLWALVEFAIIPELLYSLTLNICVLMICKDLQTHGQ